MHPIGQSAAGAGPGRKDKAMGWFTSEPQHVDKHVLKAKKLDAKAEKATRKGDAVTARELKHKADKAAGKGGWF